MDKSVYVVTSNKKGVILTGIYDTLDEANAVWKACGGRVDKVCLNKTYPSNEIILHQED